MDERLLAEKGIKPAEVRLGYVDGYELRIGERATLVPRPGSRAYGAIMDIAADKLAALYTEKILADYFSAQVTVELNDGDRLEASCYILPASKVTGTNNAYAQSLLEIAARLELPDAYLDEIRKSKA